MGMPHSIPIFAPGLWNHGLRPIPIRIPAVVGRGLGLELHNVAPVIRIPRRVSGADLGSRIFLGPLTLASIGLGMQRQILILAPGPNPNHAPWGQNIKVYGRLDAQIRLRAVGAILA